MSKLIVMYYRTILKLLSANLNQPWIVVGECNLILNVDERLRAKTPSLRKIQYFWDQLRTCQLQDLGFHGPKFTWKNGRILDKRNFIHERLDSFLGNEQSHTIFPISKGYHLPKTHLNHAPIMVTAHHKPNVHKRF